MGDRHRRFVPRRPRTGQGQGTRLEELSNGPERHPGYACDRLFLPVEPRLQEPEMLHENIPNLSKFVEPDRVRREVYTDAAIFEAETGRIHERVWIYCVHDTQLPRAGA